MIYKLKKVIRTFLHDLLHPSNNDCLNFYWDKNNNFGDELNPLLLQALSGKKITRVRPKYYANDYILMIGSILQNATEDAVVWGTGIISNEHHCAQVPKKVCAVRGPKTRARLLTDGIACPEIYGDPALLLPMVYSPPITKRYKLGIIPHFIDKNNPWLKQCETHDDILIIDVEQSNPLDFVDELLSCEKIASSSLHGIIIADAYHIPSLWLEFSDQVIGNGFKFFDYFLSVKRTDTGPLCIKEETTLEELYNAFYDYTIDIDLNRLLEAAPFEINIQPLHNVKSDHKEQR